MRNALSLMLIVCAGFSCESKTTPDSSNTTSAQSPAQAGEIAPKPSDAWFECRAVSDCELVFEGCCDHCNGGKMHAVNKTHKDAFSATLSKSDCGGVPCTELYCREAVATCDAGRCGYKDQAEEPALWSACEKPEDCTIVEYGCCDYCNGGLHRSVNVAHVSAFRSILSPFNCDGQVCSALACRPLIPTCEAGMCTFVKAPE